MLTMMVVGRPCAPWNAIGDRKKETHAAHLPFLVFLYELYHKEFDLVLTECTEFFDTAAYKPLHLKYRIIGIVMGPENLG